MKTITRNGTNVDKPVARNAACTKTGGTTIKQKRTDRIRGKSQSTRSHQEIPGWHKQLDTLIHSVEQAWAAAETMRLALEECDPQARQSAEEEPLNDVF
jgi:hypothetical protein